MKSCLASCALRIIILLFLAAMVGITFSPFIVDRYGGIKAWGIQAYRLKTFIGECLRER